MHKLALAASALLFSTLAPSQSFVNFESPQTHPIAVSADGNRLYAVNTPDNRLAVYTLANPDRPVLLREIDVGLEPVSVTPRTADEVWVVNRVGDSVSVVSTNQGVVTHTIRLNDEPADVIFAGSPEVALISVSGAEELVVVDVLSHAVLATVPIFGDEPRALAKSADGSTVWLAVHRSGNRTTIVPENLAPAPPPPTNGALPAAPQQGIIVDATNPAWQAAHGVTLPDYDVFEIDVATRTIARRYTGVGTNLFNIAVHPATGDLWVANTEALNLVRFEPNLRGHFIDSRLTRITPGSSPTIAIHDLNPGINYAVMPNPAAVSTALSQPTDVAFVGSELWVAAFGTDRVATVDGGGNVTGFVELGAPGAAADPRNKRGPRGIAVHPSTDRLYVLNRLSSTLSVIDSTAKTELREMPLGYDPTPATIADGRGFLYDAKLSGNGTASCAACHVDGELDGEAWDLGDPGGDMQNFTHTAVINGFPIPLPFSMHPMKGPMTTQTLRGLTPDTAPFHWRGDRGDFVAFNPAFDALMGGSQLSAGDMADYAAFAETMVFPPNPNQNRDRTLPTTPVGTSPQDGFVFFTSTPFTTGVTCNTCHALPNGTNGAIIPAALLQEPQDFKVPQLRNAYKRMGKVPVGGQSTSGFGFLHDGSLDSPFDLLGLPVFQGLATQVNNRRKLENFILALDTGIAPAVGYSVTVTQANVNDVQVANDVALLEQQAQAGNCDLIVKGVFQGAPRGFTFSPGGSNYQSDSTALGSLTLAQLESEITTGNATLTFVGVPVGSGVRMGIDRELNSVLDGDEGLVSYGQPSPACNPSMRLRGNSAPHIGNTLFAVLADGAPASAAGIFYMNVNQISLPFKDLTFLVGLASPASITAPSDATGVGIFELPIPDLAILVGATVYTQAIFPEPCGLTGLGLSDGLAITIGQN